MKSIYFPIIDAICVRSYWMNRMTDDFIDSRLRRRNQKKRRIAVPAIEAGENDSMVPLKADAAVEEHDIKNQTDPEKVDSDASVVDVHVRQAKEKDDDVYYNAFDTSYNKHENEDDK